MPYNRQNKPIPESHKKNAQDKVIMAKRKPAVGVCNACGSKSTIVSVACTADYSIKAKSGILSSPLCGKCAYDFAASSSEVKW